MRHFLFFYLLAAMAFLLTACSMQSPEADLSAADANTESVSNNATQSGVAQTDGRFLFNAAPPSSLHVAYHDRFSGLRNTSYHAVQDFICLRCVPLLAVSE